MAARRRLHALMDELVVKEELTRSHQRALGRLTCASGHLKEGVLAAARILGAEYEQLLVSLQSQAAGIEQQLADLPIEIDGPEPRRGDQLG